MKILIIIIFLLTLSSCNYKPPSTDLKVATSSSSDSTESISTVNLDKKDFKSVIFDKGGEHHLTDTCDFLFECDCCSGKFYFDSDSTFLQVEICMSDYTLLKGSFEVKNEFLVLTYDPDVTLKNYNYENEIDTSAVDYFFKDTVFDLSEVTYMTTKCENKILLKDQNSDEAALESKISETEMIEYLTNQGFKKKN